MGQRPTDPTIIRSFSGEYRFLSNFHPSPIRAELAASANSSPLFDRIYPTAEHMYQAWKTDDPQWWERIAEARTAATAKRLGQQAPLRPDWEEQKFHLMEQVLLLKFGQNPDLGGQLAATGTAVLVEGNSWHDQTWGDCSCPEHNTVPGRNALGVILMRLRLDWQRGIDTAAAAVLASGHDLGDHPPAEPASR